MNILIYLNIFRYEYSFVSYSYHFSDTNIFGYSFVLLFWYKYILVFVRVIFLIRIYSDIRSYRFLDINIFEYSFVSKIHIRHTLLQTLDMYVSHLLLWEPRDARPCHHCQSHRHQQRVQTEQPEALQHQLPGCSSWAEDSHSEMFSFHLAALQWSIWPFSLLHKVTSLVNFHTEG